MFTFLLCCRGNQDIELSGFHFDLTSMDWISFLKNGFIFLGELSGTLKIEQFGFNPGIFGTIEFI
jgi:hypothetical protein